MDNVDTAAEEKDPDLKSINVEDATTVNEDKENDKTGNVQGEDVNSKEEKILIENTENSVADKQNVEANKEFEGVVVMDQMSSTEKLQLASEEALSDEELIRYHKQKKSIAQDGVSQLNLGGVFSRKTLNWTGASWEQDEVERRLEHWIRPLLQPRVEAKNSLNVGEWRPDLGQAVLSRWSGRQFDVLGCVHNNTMHLWPEEALFLLECSQLELKHCGIPMSIQRAYFVMLSGSLGLDRYLVYSKLIKFGYKVVRHQGDLGITSYERDIGLDQYETRNKRKMKSLKGTQILKPEPEHSEVPHPELCSPVKKEEPRPGDEIKDESVRDAEVDANVELKEEVKTDIKEGAVDITSSAKDEEEKEENEECQSSFEPKEEFSSDNVDTKMDTDIQCDGDTKECELDEVMDITNIEEKSSNVDKEICDEDFVNGEIIDHGEKVEVNKGGDFLVSQETSQSRSDDNVVTVSSSDDDQVYSPPHSSLTVSPKYQILSSPSPRRRGKQNNADTSTGNEAMLVDLCSDEEGPAAVDDADEVVEIPMIDQSRVIEYAISTVSTNQIRNLDEEMSRNRLQKGDVQSGHKHASYMHQNQSRKAESRNVRSENNYCEACDVQVESLPAFRIHLMGKRHIKTLKRIATGDVVPPAPTKPKLFPPAPTKPKLFPPAPTKPKLFPPATLQDNSKGENATATKTKNEILNEIPNCFGLPYIDIKAPSKLIPTNCRPSRPTYSIRIKTGFNEITNFESIIAACEDTAELECRVCKIQVRNENHLVSHIKSREHMQVLNKSKGSKMKVVNKLQNQDSNKNSQDGPCRGLYPKHEYEISITSLEKVYNFGHHMAMKKSRKRKSRIEKSFQRSQQLQPLGEDLSRMRVKDHTKEMTENVRNGDNVVVEDHVVIDLSSDENESCGEDLPKKRSKHTEDANDEECERDDSIEIIEMDEEGDDSVNYVHRENNKGFDGKSDIGRSKSNSGNERSRSTSRNGGRRRNSKSESRSRSNSGRSRSDSERSRSNSGRSRSSQYDSWSDSSNLDDVEAHPELRLLKSSVLGSLWSYEQQVGPLICPEMAESMRSIFNRIQLGPDPKQLFKKSESRQFEIAFDCYKSSSNFRKSVKMAPDYRVVVVDSQSAVPDNSQLIKLENKFADKVPFLFAVVDRGTVTFATLSSFSLPTFYEDEN